MRRLAYLAISGTIAVVAMSGSALAGGCKTGMTWGYGGDALTVNNSPVTGAILVGCLGTCDAVNGDTACKKKLPVLCKYQDPAKLPQPADVYVPDGYHAWAAEVVGTTPKVSPCGREIQGHLSGAIAYCQAEFGPNWTVAEHHDSQVTGGIGWDAQVYGGVVGKKPKDRYWVDINDQPDGTCWDRN